MTHRCSRRQKQLGAAMLLTLSASGCSAWRAEHRPLPAPFDGRARSQIRIFTKARETIAVYDARLVGDSIIGLNQPRSSSRASRIAIAASDVAEVSYLTVDGWTTLSTTAGVIAVATLALVLAAAITCGAAY